MSEWGRNSSGEVKTAFEFHDDYLDFGTTSDSFSCPFCCIKLFGKNIYKDGKIGKTPHFSIFSGSPHINECDGYPLDSKKTTTKKPIRLVQEIDMDFPVELIERAPPRLNIPSDDDNETIPSFDLVQKRRRAARSWQVAVHTSSLLRNFAKSYIKIKNSCFKYAIKNGFANDRKKLKSLQDSELSTYPLKIDAELLSYKTAFMWSSFTPNLNTRRIYEGKGSIIKSPLGYELISKDNAPKFFKGEDKIPVVIFISNELLNFSGAASYAKEQSNKIKELIEKSDTNHWFALGKMNQENDRFVLELESLNHLYFHE